VAGYTVIDSNCKIDRRRKIHWKPGQRHAGCLFVRESRGTLQKKVVVEVVADAPSSRHPRVGPNGRNIRRKSLNVPRPGDRCQGTQIWNENRLLKSKNAKICKQLDSRCRSTGGCPSRNRALPYRILGGNSRRGRVQLSWYIIDARIGRTHCVVQILLA
jgi:hypothetical protein